MPDIGWPLAVCQELGIFEKKFQGMVFKFCKIYDREKILKIVSKAKSYPWRESSPGPAFMKAIGEINREEKNANKD